MKEKPKKASVGSRIIEGLREFAETLEKGEPIAEQFNCRVVELQLRPTAYSPELVKKTRALSEPVKSDFAKACQG